MYTPGEGFGELALDNHAPRAATIRAMDEPCEYITLSKQDYCIVTTSVNKGKDGRDTTNEDVLNKFLIFEHLGRNGIHQLSFFLKPVHIK